jgi:8-oxo-dGTP diphosphatase
MAGQPPRPPDGQPVIPAGAIHVVAGVLSDARGRVLLARRTAGRDLAGAWEFPGGKVEPGETALQALDRELHEELGIRIDGAEPLISVPQAYPGKRIVLDVYRVRAFSGSPRGREKQALAWAPADKLSTYPMPPADRPVVAALLQPALYLVSPDADAGASAFLAGVEAALACGVRQLQLRLPGCTEPQRRELAIAALALCDRHQSQLLINGDLALATELGCGLHLRADQLMALDTRPLPPGRLVAASCHDAAELARAEALGLDFVVLGPVAATASHPGQVPVGWPRFAELRETVSLPIYAIGGLARGDVAMARRCGAQGIAAIRGLWPDVT